MVDQMTLYCIRQKGTHCYVLRPDSRTIPMLFCHPHTAKAALTTRVNKAHGNVDDYEVVPVYFTVSVLNVEDMDSVEQTDKDVKQRIKQLGLSHIRGGKHHDPQT